MPKLTATSPSQPLKSIHTFLPWVLIICGVIGLLASVMITTEKFQLLQHPNTQFICDLNPIISCGSVMESKQASAFGFMNTYIGLVGFPVLITTGVTMLAGARFKRWYWLGMQVGLGLGVLFAYWLLFESMYDIKALCPYCLSVDVAITVAFWYITLHNFYEGFIRLPVRFQRIGQFVKRHHADILVLWFIVLIVLILQHFWYYFGQQI